MCAGGGGGRPPPPPPPPPPDKSLRAQRAASRRKELSEMAKLKDERYQETLADIAGRRGRRSLLTGRKGGQGYGSMVTDDTGPRQTLGV
tara:strand:- start:942 stop:1208 length:267 start_codon:yes stop_codon:yes gene_type:complete